MAAAPGAPGHVLSYMHSLEIMQRYSQVLAAARDLLSVTRCTSALPMHVSGRRSGFLYWALSRHHSNLTMAHVPNAENGFDAGIFHPAEHGLPVYLSDGQS